MNTFLSFGTWLKARRRAIGLTQSELAKQAYCAEITIRKIEADQLRPSLELAALIVNALNIAPIEQSNVVHLARQR
ncbi:MAG: XRE family transcriptional regulator [Chloroflexota bacterium]|nr:MAG: XRE family transcriptional regulator [Chloroflexota bacterium]